MLFVAAIFIVGLSLWYTGTLVSKISSDERKKATLWAEAIQKKANLVKYTNNLFSRISSEERKKVELWAKGTRMLASPDFNMDDISFIFEVIKNNETVPVILADRSGNIISFRNLDSARSTDKEYLSQEMLTMRMAQPPIEISIGNGQMNYLYYKDSRLFSELKLVLDDLIESFISEVAINSASVPVIYTDSSQATIIAIGNIDSAEAADPQYLQQKIDLMRKQNKPIEIELGNDGKNYIFYEDSTLLTQLKYFPLVQFGIIAVFLFVAYTLFSTARKAEQNQVWLGMSKETAHQLGTPLSSLMAWLEILRSQGGDEATLNEIQQDIGRLEMITERFSKIGSPPALEKELLKPVLDRAIGYLKKRLSNNVNFILHMKDESIKVSLNPPLFEWVMENLCKNAVDAMKGQGAISINIQDQTQFVYIDVTDTGSGLPKSKYKSIFEPGYTTKSRGWGLGLSLSKRIIENYHNGKIFVLNSEPGKGTTFRIVLNK